MRTVRLIATSGVAIFGGCVLLCAVEGALGDGRTPNAKLAAKGIHATRSGFSLLAEAEFLKAVSTAKALKRRRSAAINQPQSIGSDNQEAAAQVAALMQQNGVLRERLSEINRASFSLRGQVVRQINDQIAANEEQIALIRETLKQSTKSIDERRQNQNSVLQKCVQEVREARKLAERIIACYGELNRDKEVVAALKEWNEAAHTSYSLKPSRSFESALKRLEGLEKDIVPGQIPLRKEGESYYATVAINGDKICEMVVDAAAPMIVLPYRVAVDAGVDCDAASQTTTTQFPDGSKVQAKRVLLKSVRLGSFSAKNVPCDVLPAKNTTAKAILGISFLSQFKFKLNLLVPELSLERIGTNGATAGKKDKPKRKHTIKKSAELDLSGGDPEE
jgi:clan AA aspartic protease (TIGR02281 family)